MTSSNHRIAPRQPDESEPRNHADRDIFDFIDEIVARITDADVEERLRRVLDQAGYRPSLAEVVKPAPPAMVQDRSIGRAAASTMDIAESLEVPGLDLRVMNRGSRTEYRVMIAQLREMLHQCPAGAFGPEASVMVLDRVATVSEALIVHRDEQAALALIRDAFPHLVFLGDRHPATFKVRRMCAEAWCELGRYRRAEMMLRRLSEDEKRAFGIDDPRTALVLLWTLVSAGRLQEAEAGFGTLDARLARRNGAGIQMTWHLQCRYSWLLGQRGLASESEASYDGVIINRSHELGTDHPDTSDARHSKGKMQVFAGNGVQALALLNDVADGRARVQGDSHPDTLETLKYLHLASLQAEPRDDRILHRAISGLERILHIQDSRHGPDYPMSRDTVFWLRKLFQLQDAIRFGEPIPDLRRVTPTRLLER